MIGEGNYLTKLERGSSFKRRLFFRMKGRRDDEYVSNLAIAEGELQRLSKCKEAFWCQRAKFFGFRQVI